MQYHQYQQKKIKKYDILVVVYGDDFTNVSDFMDRIIEHGLEKYEFNGRKVNLHFEKVSFNTFHQVVRLYNPVFISMLLKKFTDDYNEEHSSNIHLVTTQVK